jgi:hypothetical protein
MTDIAAGQFTIDSDLSLAADGYTAELASSAAFLAASDADTITLKAGFRDPATGTSYQVGHLVGGIDEYELTITPDGITGRIQGRDHMAQLIDRNYQKKYLRVQPTAVEKSAMDDRVFDEQPDPILYIVGTFRASEIAREVVEACGLTLSWECRDYTLLEDFDATGRPLDILRKLVEPWSQVEPLKVDVFVQGTVVICRPRTLTLVPDYTYPIKDARIKQTVLRRRPAEIYGRVTLYGQGYAGLLGSGVYQPSEVDETTDSETKDEAENVLQRVVRTTTYRMPERVPIRIREQTYDRQSGGQLVLVKDEQTENEWETVAYDDRGATSQPRQLRQSTRVSADKLNGKSIPYQVVQQAYVAYSYETEGYQDMTTTRKWELKKSGAQLEETERVTRTMKEVSHLEVEEVTTVEKRGKSGDFYVAQRDVNKSAGVRPAGPRPGRTIVIGGGALDPSQQILAVDWISTDQYAKHVQYSNRNLTAQDLEFILAQFRAVSGLWEYELSLTYLSMPWLRKGNVLQLTGLLAEDGTPIPLGPALVVQQTLNYDEASNSPSMLSTLTARYWLAT